MSTRSYSNSPKMSLAPPEPGENTKLPSPGAKRSGTPKLRDALGFRMKRQNVDRTTLTAYDQLGGSESTISTLQEGKTIHEEETEGAGYILDGRLRRVLPYYFTYLTYCKLRWRDRKLIDVFIDEFRDRDAEFYRYAISEGQVALNRKPANIDSIVRNGDLISHRCHRHEPAVSSRPIKIVHEDEDVIAIDKPLGIPVHPVGRYRYNTITKIFQHEFGQVVHPCNRLDRLTSGLMFLGKTPKGADRVVQQIKERTVRKEYLARVIGQFPAEITVEKPLRTVSPKHTLNMVDLDSGKEAITMFKRISYDPESNTSIVKCFPKTGRTHQIRVHLQHIGHAIANDPIYSNAHVWGESLGKGIVDNYEEVIAKLDRVGKDVPASTWIHPIGDGERLSGKNCEICQLELYTDPGPNDLDLWLHAFLYASADESWSYLTEYPEWALESHRTFMEMAVAEAEKCGETQTQFNVGAVLVHEGKVLATGHSRELPGNTHAEQCALEKFFSENNQADVPEGSVIYTTMEPCSFRLSGNEPCVQRILKTAIKTCFVGVIEPDTFVKDNSSMKQLADQGVEYVKIPGYEDRCLEIATRGHDKGLIKPLETATEKENEAS